MMFESSANSRTNTPLSPESFLATIEAVMETDWLANLANFSALVMSEFRDLNWVGFYLMKPAPLKNSVANGGAPGIANSDSPALESPVEELVLGPFQGSPACIRIRLGKGVCGTAAKENRMMIVDDVDQFPGHIVCDSASKSEVVIPIFAEGRVRGVLDVDAPILSRFDKITAETLEKAVKILVSKTTWPASF